MNEERKAELFQQLIDYICVGTSNSETKEILRNIGFKEEELTELGL